MNEQLPLPDGAAEDPEAMEVARIWVTRSDLLVSLNVGAYAESETSETLVWGDIVADSIAQIANALSLRYSISPEVAQEEIVTRCLASLDEYKKNVAGGFTHAT